jgi:hypothetical protein
MSYLFTKESEHFHRETGTRSLTPLALLRRQEIFMGKRGNHRSSQVNLIEQNIALVLHGAWLWSYFQKREVSASVLKMERNCHGEEPRATKHSLF